MTPQRQRQFDASSDPVVARAVEEFTGTAHHTSCDPNDPADAPMSDYSDLCQTDPQTAFYAQPPPCPHASPELAATYSTWHPSRHAQRMPLAPPTASQVAGPPPTATTHRHISHPGPPPTRPHTAGIRFFATRTTPNPDHRIHQLRGSSIPTCPRQQAPPRPTRHLQRCARWGGAPSAQRLARGAPTSEDFPYTNPYGGTEAQVRSPFPIQTSGIGSPEPHSVSISSPVAPAQPSLVADEFA